MPDWVLESIMSYTVVTDAYISSTVTHALSVTEHFLVEYKGSSLKTHHVNGKEDL